MCTTYRICWCHFHIYLHLLFGINDTFMPRSILLYFETKSFHKREIIKICHLLISILSLYSQRKRRRNTNWYFNISNLSKLQIVELFSCSWLKNQNSVIKMKFLMSDLAGPPDLVRKQKQGFGAGSLPHLCVYCRRHHAFCVGVW